MDQQTEIGVRVGLLSGASTTTFGWIASVDWIATVGVIVLVLSFFVNFVFKRREDTRKQERHIIEMQMLKEKS
tara:strand:- start:29975 stop:30193 length:219 start_codon:yes stop_codon:yes gene_type:complete